MTNITKISVVLFFFSMGCFEVCEAQSDNPQKNIREFLDLVMLEPSYSADEIKEKFIYLQSVHDSLRQKQHDVLARSIGHTKKRYADVYKNDKGRIIQYSELDKSQKISFDKREFKNIYAVVFASPDIDPIYILTKGDKIFSFDYIIKGTDGPAYFLSY
jgi:hypothetical protein